MAIKFRLDEIMEEQNLTIQDVHEATGISRNTISQMINKEPKGIQFDTLDKLVSVLEIKVQDLVHYESDKKESFTIKDLNDGDYSPSVKFKGKSISDADFDIDEKMTIDYIELKFRFLLTINTRKISNTEITLPITATGFFPSTGAPKVVKGEKVGLNKDGEKRKINTYKFPFTVEAKVENNGAFLHFLKEEDADLYHQIQSELDRLVFEPFKKYIPNLKNKDS